LFGKHLAALKGLSRQFRFALEWYGWLGLGSDVLRCYVKILILSLLFFNGPLNFFSDPH
jgi:hypothetical protein